MNSYFTIILYVVEGSDRENVDFLHSCHLEKNSEWNDLRKDVFIFNLTGIYQKPKLSFFNQEKKKKQTS